MTRSTPIHCAPGRAYSSEQTIRHLIRLLDESRALTHLRTSEHFARALEIWLAALHQVKLASWLDACAGMEKALGPLQKALALLMMEGQENYQDLLGAAYMRLSQGDKRLGQYFTPSGVARMMAELNLSDVQLPAPGEQPIRIYEPTCGSGVLILASAEMIERRFPGSVQQGAVQFFGIDLDPLCVQMAQVNMLLHGVGRIKLDLDGEPNALATRTISFDKPVPALFQPAKIIQGDALAADAELSQRFRDEARFPWIPIMVHRRPGADVPAGEKTDQPGAARQHYAETVASSICTQRLPGTILDERAETIALVARDPEEVPATLQIQFPPAQGKRRSSPLPSAADFVQPELFPRFF